MTPIPEEGGTADLAFAALLRRRAVRLALPRGGPSGAEGLPVLAFRLGPETYGLPLAALSEVAPLARCAAVPGWPAALLGVTNRRGSLVPVLDLRALLDLPPPTDPGADPGSGPAVLFLRAAREVGLRVDALDEVRRAADDQRGPPPDSGSPLVEAVLTDGLILLDARRILALPFLGPAADPLPDRETD